VRVVLDPNVIVSALLSSSGPPARIVQAWREGAFEVVVSDSLLGELRRAFGYPKIRERIDPEDASLIVAWMSTEAIHVEDPGHHGLALRSRDAGDDYLLALAASARALLVTGDTDLLELGEALPIHSPRAFLELIEPHLTS